jgi:hypothetical protein
LAIKYNATSFTPHSTLYAGPSNLTEACRIAKSITQKFQPVQLVPQKLAYTNLFYKTAFVQFHASNEVRNICETIRSESETPSTYVLDPHLSLLYKNITEKEQITICETTALPTEPYLFDKIQVVEAPTEENDEAVRTWQKVFEANLAGTPHP